MYVYIYIYTYIYIYIHIYTCTYTYMHICIYMCAGVLPRAANGRVQGVEEVEKWTPRYDVSLA